MSGKTGTLGTVGGIVGGAAGAIGGFFAGGPAGAWIGGTSGFAAGAGLGASVGSSQDAAHAQRVLQGQLLQPISTPRVLPTIDSAAVQNARTNRLLQIQSRSGRASTLLTNSSTFG